MDENDWLARRFEEHRPHLSSVAYRMLGSLPDAEDAVQDAWIRVSRAGADDVENLGGWLTTVVARVCLNKLRSRSTRREEPLEVHIPDPVVTPYSARSPDDEVVMADSVGLAMQVVVDTLAPAERVAFVLHDMFDLTFDQIGPLLGRTPTAARKVASRARRRVQDGRVPVPDPDVRRQRAVVDAFFSAARSGRFDTLLTLLHPEVVLRADFAPLRPQASTLVRGADEVVREARLGANPEAVLIPALVNGAAGVVITLRGRPLALMAFTVVDDLVAEIDVIGDADRIRRVADPVLGGNQI